ncbi:MAG: sugar transferase [Phycisphaerales bacterium]|nr:sugar transferase [Phycisphaerales bacterium]
MVAPTPSMSSATRTIWGLEPLDLHTRFWAAHGVQVVRQGEPSQIVKHAELFLLTDPRSLCLFKLSQIMDTMNWIGPTVMFIRLHDTRERGYRERAVTDPADRFVRFERLYDSPGRLARVVITPYREVAQLWQSAPDPLTGWRRLRRFTPRIERVTLSIDGRVYDRTSDREIASFIRDLIRDWKRPDATIDRAQRCDGESWRDPASTVSAEARLIGPVWIGAGRSLTPGTTVIGPAVVWDDPRHRPPVEEIEWQSIEPTAPPQDIEPPAQNPIDLAFKRAFDIVFSLVALLLTVPFYPLIMLAIWLEDGRPFFYGHKRETVGPREFRCWKFRSMVNNSDELTRKLIAEGKNRGDGGRVDIPPEEDPRLLKVGRFLRKYNIDELPQFWNVLIGEMSVVGPRPSPFRENQYCPAWREARLSVRPGITGLWQIRRTRRTGQDFQEWIKYDIEYVEKRSFWLDMLIIARTIVLMARKGTRQ